MHKRATTQKELRRPPKGGTIPLTHSGKPKLELVAHIAAHLLEGTDYAGAAERAFGLIDACEEKAAERSIRSQISDLSRYIPFNDAVQQITGHGDPEHAREVFYYFFALALLLLYGPGVDSDSAEELIEFHGNNGFAPEVVSFLKAFFLTIEPGVRNFRRKVAPKIKKKRRKSLTR